MTWVTSSSVETPEPTGCQAVRRARRASFCAFGLSRSRARAWVV
ncbi:hypothetical protein [uncultured Kocuria sp.]